MTRCITSMYIDSFWGHFKDILGQKWQKLLTIEKCKHIGKGEDADHLQMIKSSNPGCFLRSKNDLTQLDSELWTTSFSLCQPHHQNNHICSCLMSVKMMMLESAAVNMPANLEDSALATGLEKVTFHSNPKERQCQRMLKLPHNCTHLTH